MQLIGIDTRVLSTLRAIAVVGFVLISRLRDVSLWEHTSKEQEKPATATAPSPQANQKQAPDSTQMAQPNVTEEQEKLLFNLFQQYFQRVTIVQEEDTTGQKPVLKLEMQEQQGQIDTKKSKSKQDDEATKTNQGTSNEQAPSRNLPGNAKSSKQESNEQSEKERIVPAQDEERTFIEAEQRLAVCYQELKTPGQRISGRALAQYAHVRRSTCLGMVTHEQRTLHKVVHQAAMHKLVGATDTFQQDLFAGIIQKRGGRPRQVIGIGEPEADHEMLNRRSKPTVLTSEQSNRIMTQLEFSRIRCNICYTA